MFKVSAREYIRTIRNLCLPTDWNEGRVFHKDGSRSKPGCIIPLECRMSEYRADQSRHGLTVYVAIALCGNTNSFVAISEDRFSSINLPKPEVFENVSNHDSCWISAVDGKLSSVYFDLANKLNPDVAPKDLDDSCCPGPFIGPYRAMIRMANDVEDERMYRQKIVEITKI